MHHSIFSRRWRTTGSRGGRGGKVDDLSRHDGGRVRDLRVRCLQLVQRDVVLGRNCAQSVAGNDCVCLFATAAAAVRRLR